MIKLKQLITEINEQNITITIDGIRSMLSKSWSSKEMARSLNLLLEFYNDGNPKHKLWVEEYLALVNKVLNRVILIAKNLQIPHIDITWLKENLFNHEEFLSDEKDFFPIPLYISAQTSGDESEATIGIMVDVNGKILEIHEGNDEASDETINLANKLVNPQGKQVRIYASHTRELVFKIDESGYIPEGLYVSPDLGHAKAYKDLQGERETFTGFIDINSVSRESDLDWRTIEVTKINKFRFI